MDASCECGAVAFKTPTPEPLALYICHCAECRRQSSSGFGASAIFPRFEIPITDLLSCYARPTSTGKTLYCYFCRTCGTRLFHIVPDRKVMSIKGGCLAGLDWTKAIHIWTKSAMVPIPESVESSSMSMSDGTGSTPLSLSPTMGESPRELIGCGQCFTGSESFAGNESG